MRQEATEARRTRYSVRSMLTTLPSTIVTSIGNWRLLAW
jgi:hypothetical protein